jgi:hypothetical protein
MAALTTGNGRIDVAILEATVGHGDIQQWTPAYRNFV